MHGGVGVYPFRVIFDEIFLDVIYQPKFMQACAALGACVGGGATGLGLHCGLFAWWPGELLS